MVEAIGALAGVEDLHPHRLRHTGAAGLLRQGMDPAHAMRLTGHTDARSFRRYTLGAEQEAAVAAFYRVQESSQELVFARSLSREQRWLLMGLAELTGKEPTGQVALDEGTISFGELWRENVEGLEQLLDQVYGLPDVYGVDVALRDQGAAARPSPAVSLDDGAGGMSLLPTEVELRLKLRVEDRLLSGRKKGKVRKEIERQVLSRFQMRKPKKRGMEYDLVFAFVEEDELTQIMSEMAWEMNAIAELDNCLIEWEWVGQVL